MLSVTWHYPDTEEILDFQTRHVMINALDAFPLVEKQTVTSWSRKQGNRQDSRSQPKPIETPHTPKGTRGERRIYEQSDAQYARRLCLGFFFFFFLFSYLSLFREPPLIV